MPNLVAMKTKDGEILVEAEFSQGKLEEIGVIDNALERIEVSFKSISEVINKCSADLIELFDEQHSMHKNMRSAEIEFGIKVSGEGNAYIAKSTGEVNIAVKLNWEFIKE